MPRDTPIHPSTPVSAETGCLPRGFRLRDFVIERVLAEGGFGVVYVAIDARLQRRVAIKEYMPAALARRGGDLSVLPRSSVPLQDAFAVGLRSFINEARMLAGFDHPALVRVLQFWEDKGTGFMVMPLYQAPTVRQWTLGRAALPDPDWLAAFVAQMLEALDLVHGVACLHRDIAPDNILLQRDRDPLLLDFGAARRVIEQMTQALTAIVKPGFAPIEQYAQADGLRQGPWTDLYALCATLHFMLTRRPPPPAVGRAVADDYVPLALALRDRYPAALLAAIDAGLAVRPADRPQSVAEFRTLMRGAMQASAADPAADAPHDPCNDDATVPVTVTAPVTAPAAAAGAEPGTHLPLAGPRAQPTADALADMLWRRPVARRTALATLVLAALAGVGGVMSAPDMSPAADASGEVVAAAPVALVPTPITRAQASTVAPTVASAIESAIESTTASIAAPAVDPAPTPPAASSAIGGLPEAPGSAGPSSPTLPLVAGSATAVPATAAPPRVSAAAPITATPARLRTEADPGRNAARDLAPEGPSAQRMAELARLNEAAKRRADLAPARRPTPAVASSAEPQPRGADTANLAAAPAQLPAADQATPMSSPAEATPPLRGLDQPRPPFPADAARDGIQHGRVVARLHVTAEGRVEKVDIIASTPRRAFDRAVLAAAGQWRYQPPGQPRQVDVEFVFRRDS